MNDKIILEQIIIATTTNSYRIYGRTIQGAVYYYEPAEKMEKWIPLPMIAGTLDEYKQFKQQQYQEYKTRQQNKLPNSNK
jgi:hypothetical protein